MTNDMSFYIGGELNIKKISRKNFEFAAEEMEIGQKLFLSE